VTGFPASLGRGLWLEGHAIPVGRVKLHVIERPGRTGEATLLNAFAGTIGAMNDGVDA
jgi:hypothetical protein